MKGLDEKITDELVAGILNVIEEKVTRIVLYGSVARGTDTKESDVDVALLLTKSMFCIVYKFFYLLSIFNSHCVFATTIYVNPIWHRNFYRFGYILRI